MNRPHPSASTLRIFVSWSANTGRPTIGTPWYFDSTTLPRPPWLTNRITFLWAEIEWNQLHFLNKLKHFEFSHKISSWGNHFPIKMLSVCPGSTSASHLNTTRCFNLANVLTMASNLSFERSELFKFDPKLKNIAPCSAPSKNVWIFCKEVNRNIIKVSVRILLIQICITSGKGLGFDFTCNPPTSIKFGRLGLINPWLKWSFARIRDMFRITWS